MEFYRYVYDDFLPELIPEQRLWLVVALTSILDLKNGLDSNGHAQDFIFNEENDFFGYAALGLGLTAGALRSKVEKMLRKQKLKVVA